MNIVQETVVKWESIHQSRVWGSYPNEAIVRLVKRARFEPYARALDIGCGTGANTWFMAREGFEVTGIDGSATALIRASDRIARDGLNANFVHGIVPDVFKGIKDRAFDLVVDSYCLYLLSGEDLAHTLKEIHRMLRPGGRFISLFFAPDTSTAVLAEGGGAVRSEEEILALFKDFGSVTTGWESRKECVGNSSLVVNTWVVSAIKES
jgi:SAM-dependent methyltransferase